MSSEGGLEDFSLMDLFRSEVETHSEVLSAALLALERSPGDTSRVDEMMRAAHSIKGAARVVGVDPAVSVAHVMEDCFVAAQKGALTLLPGDVDVLLRGVDLLGKISEATRDPKADLANDFGEPVKSLVVELEAMLVPRGSRAEGRPRSRRGRPRPPAVEAPVRTRSRPPRQCPRRRCPRDDDRGPGNPRFDGRGGDPPAVSCPRSSAVATRSGSTCGRRRTWTSRGWRSWPRSPVTPPGTAARVSSWRGCPRRWRRCSS